jgi:hypothetical protein
MTGTQIYVFSKKSLQNSKRQKGDTKQVPYSGFTNVRVQNLLAWGTWRLEYVHPALLSFLNDIYT